MFVGRKYLAKDLPSFGCQNNKFFAIRCVVKNDPSHIAECPSYFVRTACSSSLIYCRLCIALRMQGGTGPLGKKNAKYLAGWLSYGDGSLGSTSRIRKSSRKKGYTLVLDILVLPLTIPTTRFWWRNLPPSFTID